MSFRQGSPPFCPALGSVNYAAGPATVPAAKLNGAQVLVAHWGLPTMLRAVLSSFSRQKALPDSSVCCPRALSSSVARLSFSQEPPWASSLSLPQRAPRQLLQELRAEVEAWPCLQVLRSQRGWRSRPRSDTRWWGGGVCIQKGTTPHRRRGLLVRSSPPAAPGLVSKCWNWM